MVYKYRIGFELLQKFVWMSLLLAAVGTSGRGAAATTYSVELLGNPCHSFNFIMGRVVANPQTGRDELAMTNMNEARGELVFVDWEKGTARSVLCPAGQGGWVLSEVPGHRLVMGTFYDGHLMVYSLDEQKWIKSLKVPGEDYIWSACIGSDGRLYCGTYPGGKIVALNLSNYELEDLGAPAKPDLYARNLSALPDGRVFCNFGMENHVNLILDPATKEFTSAPAHLQDKEVKGGVAWGDYFICGSEVCDGHTLQKVKRPFPSPAGTDKWSANMDLTTTDTLYANVGNSIYRYRKGETTWTLLGQTPRGGRIFGMGRNGDLAGRRGQDYFSLRPGQREVELHHVPAESAPRPSLFLRLDGKGNIWGGPDFGQNVFVMNIATGQTTNTGVVTASGGEVYNMAFDNGIGYMVSYSGGEIIRYDPDAPWDEYHGKNPRTIAKLEPKGYIRPAAGIIVGPDGMLYSAWWAAYGSYGGAVSITDRTSGKTEMIENPLPVKQSIGGIAVDDKCIYLCTTIMANGLPEKPNEAPHFGVVDRETHKVLFDYSITTYDAHPSTQSVAIALDASANRLALSADGKLKLFDTEKREFVTAAALDDAPRVDSLMMVAPGNGMAYYGGGHGVMEINLKKASWRRIADLPGAARVIEVARDGTVYAACDADVYRVKEKPLP